MAGNWFDFDPVVFSEVSGQTFSRLAPDAQKITTDIWNQMVQARLQGQDITGFYDIIDEMFPGLENNNVLTTIVETMWDIMHAVLRMTANKHAVDLSKVKGWQYIARDEEASTPPDTSANPFTHDIGGMPSDQNSDRAWRDHQNKWGHTFRLKMHTERCFMVLTKKATLTLIRIGNHLRT